MGRPLSVIERAVATFDRAAPLNFTAYARVRGPLDEAAARVALSSIQARHPPLRLHLEGDRFVDGAPPIPLRLADDLVAAANHEIATPFVEGEALLRAVLIPGDGVLLTFHHVIGDGRSGALLARDFVQSAAAVLRGDDATLPALTAQLPIDARIPSLGFRGVLRVLYLVLLEVWQRVRYGAPLKVPRVRDLPAWERPAKVIVRWFSPSVVDALTLVARAEGVTIHTIVSAALLLAIAGTHARATHRAAFGTPLDVRKELTPPGEDEIGFLVSMLGYRGLVTRGEPLFDLARRIKRELDTEKRWQGSVIGLVLVSVAARLLSRGRSDRAVAVKFGDLLQTTSGLTNLGRLAIEASHPPLTIEAFAFTANPSVLGDFIASAATLNGHMSLWFAHASPMIDRAVAEAIADETCARVHAAVHSGPCG